MADDDERNLIIFSAQLVWPDFYGVECILKGGDLLVGFGEYAHQHGNIF